MSTNTEENEDFTHTNEGRKSDGADDSVSQ